MDSKGYVGNRILIENHIGISSRRTNIYIKNIATAAVVIPSNIKDAQFI